MFFFTADEHYHHAKIIDYCKRPFASIEEMDATLVQNHNQKVGKNDITVHIGDFGWFKREEEALAWSKRLNGNHIFVKGSHDQWMSRAYKFMWRRTIENQFVVCCHYSLRSWEQAYRGAWDLYGHNHGSLSPVGKQQDVGVDCNHFAPLSFAELKVIMSSRSYIPIGTFGER